MPRTPLKILAINPGTRYLGIALLEEGELLDWEVKVVKGKWSKRKQEKVISIVSELIEQFRPEAVAMKKLHPSRASRNLTRLVDRIVGLVRKKNLKLCCYSIGELESFFSPHEKTNRHKLGDLVASAYPVLCHELEKERSLKNPYRIRMFEAVALAAVCFRQLER
jgi:RNase H-fold protein (predicted Holliday junction resolvase)